MPSHGGKCVPGLAYEINHNPGGGARLTGKRLCLVRSGGRHATTSLLWGLAQLVQEPGRECQKRQGASCAREHQAIPSSNRDVAAEKHTSRRNERVLARCPALDNLAPKERQAATLTAKRMYSH